MSTIEERLEATGAEYRRAAESLPVRRRDTTPRRDTAPGRRAIPRRFVLATAAVVVALVGSVAVIELAFGRDASDRVEAIDDKMSRVEAAALGPELLAAFRRPAKPSDALPESIAAELAAERQPELDLSASRAGPSLDGYTVYAIPSIDGLWLCIYLVDTTGSRPWGGGCDSLAGVIASPSPRWSSGPGGTYGIVPDDVIGVEVNGERALLSDGMFLVGGSFAGPDIELNREPERAALVAACDALAPLLRPDIDADATAALVAAGRATAEPTFNDLAEVLDVPGQDGLDADEIAASGRTITDPVVEAMLRCDEAEVPGWAILYQPPAGPPGPPAPTVGLSSYGQRQDLAVTDATSQVVNGPVLGPVTRAAVGDTGVTAFAWERLNPELQACFVVMRDGRSIHSCGDRDPSGASLPIESAAGASPEPPSGTEPPLGTELQVQARSNERRAAFATAEVDGRTWVQEARGLYFVFVLPAGDATITFHGSDGTALEGPDGTVIEGPDGPGS